MAIPGYCRMRGVPRARGFFVGANLWSVPLLLGESLRPRGDLRRAWTAIGEAIPPQWSWRSGRSERNKLGLELPCAYQNMKLSRLAFRALFGDGSLQIRLEPSMEH